MDGAADTAGVVPGVMVPADTTGEGLGVGMRSDGS